MAILELRLYQLTGMERDKIDTEYADLLKTIDNYSAILDDESVLLKLVKEELLALRDKYASPRKTKIEEDAGEFRVEDVIANECCVLKITISPICNGNVIRPAITCKYLVPHLVECNGKEIVAIDEGQFFDDLQKRIQM